MRLLKIDVDSDVRVPGQGSPDVRNEISVIETDEGYELETVYAIDASGYRDSNTHTFYSGSVRLGSKDEIDEAYFGLTSATESSNSSFEDGNIAVEFYPGTNGSHRKNYELGNTNTSISPFLGDLFNLDEERLFSDTLYGGLPELLIHEENHSPVSGEEFDQWVHQLPQELYLALIDSGDEIGSMFEEQGLSRKRDFQDSLKSTFSQLTDQLGDKGYEEIPDSQELYELFTDIRGLKPVSGRNKNDHEYSTLAGQSMEEFVLQTRNEVDREDLHRMKPDESVENDNAYMINTSAEGSREESSNNLLRENYIRLIEGIVTVEDEGKLEEFLTWDIDE